MEVKNNASSSWEQIKDAWHDWQARELSKSPRQHRKEDALTSYYLGKGFARSALNTLENGFWQSCPLGTAMRQIPAAIEMIRDPQGVQTRRREKCRAFLKKAGRVIFHPQQTLQKLWNKSRDSMTSKTVAFLRADRSRQMEILGEKGGDVFFAYVVPSDLGSVKKARMLEAVGEKASVGIPGGGLVAHEGKLAANGKFSHLIERHVGKSLDYLKRRLEQKNYKQISTFQNIEEAEKFVSLALTQEQVAVEAFLTKPFVAKGRGSRLILEVDFEQPVGRILQRNAADSISGRGVWLVLERVPSCSELPYLIFTGYPILGGER